MGTGEGNLRGNVTWGDGVFKSTDAGATWTHIGLNDTRQIGALIVDPHDPNVVLVAAIGHAFGPNSERGVFRTADGGKTWSRVLYKDELTGAIDLAADPHNPKIVYAALWQVRRQPWTFESGGPGSGLYRSTDGGLTWSQLTGHGLPAGILGRIDVAVSPVDSNRIYAMIEAKEGGLYRSDDAGATWRRISDDGRIRQRAWYFSKIYADTKALDTVYALNTGMLRSVDGGKTFDLVPATHGDHHALWIDPNNANSLINANDGGASVSLDGGKTWSTQDNQPTAQFYHVATDHQFPYYVYGAQQDNSNLAIASADAEGVIGPRNWFPAGGGESGFVVPDARDPEHHLQQCGEPVRALQPPRDAVAVHQPGPHRQFRPPGQRTRPSLQLDLAADALAARSRRAVRGIGGGVEVHRPGHELEDHQPRPDAQRQVQADRLGRPAHQGHHQRRVLRHHLRTRRVAAAQGKALGGNR